MSTEMNPAITIKIIPRKKQNKGNGRFTNKNHKSTLRMRINPKINKKQTNTPNPLNILFTPVSEYNLSSCFQEDISIN